MIQDRRSVLTALGLALPLGLSGGPRAPSVPAGPAPVLGFRPFDEAVRTAFRAGSPDLSGGAAGGGEAFPCRRIAVGDSEAVQAGLQGCYNDRPFAGFPTGHLRIVRTGSGPGPIFRGVRLYVTTVDVVLTGGRACRSPGRPLDFASLPPAPTLSDRQPDTTAGVSDHSNGNGAAPLTAGRAAKPTGTTRATRA